MHRMNELQKYCKDRTEVTISLPAVVPSYRVGDLNPRHPSQFALRLLHVEVRLTELCQHQIQ